jgi:PTS system mannose-specific IIB component
MPFFVRVDDRLIHGQILHGWVPFLRTKRIIVVDEGLSRDEERKIAIRLAVPKTLEILFCSPDEIKGGEALDAETMLLFSSPLDLLKAVERGLKIVRVNLGNLHFSQGKIVLKKTFSCTHEELKALRALSHLGVKLYYQPAPEIAPSELPPLDED